MKFFETKAYLCSDGKSEEAETYLGAAESIDEIREDLFASRHGFKKNAVFVTREISREHFLIKIP